MPPALAEEGFTVLNERGCVARRWHDGGRHGSRLHRDEATKCVALPILSTHSVTTLLTTASEDTNLHRFLNTSGVSIAHRRIAIPSKIPRDEPFNATVHPEKRPTSFSSAEPLCGRQFTFCELFSGIGGFCRGLEALGGECVFASEIFEPSKAVYRANLNGKDDVVAGDIWNVASEDIPEHDLLVGGFPCQPFSGLGEQPGLSDTKVAMGRKIDVNAVADSECGGRGQLFTQIVRILKAKQPRAFLLENVPGLLQTDGGRAMETITTALSDAGYKVSYEVCSSRGLTAQSRKRVYIVGIRNGEAFQFPFMPDLGLRAKDILHTPEELASYADMGIPHSLAEEMGNVIPEALFRLSEAQMEQLLTRSRVWRPAKLAWGNTTCATLDSHYGVTVGKGNSQLVPCEAPEHPRKFTPRECARLMGFGASFRLGQHKIDPSVQQREDYDPRVAFNTFIKEQYHMLGNAVCPPVIAVLAGAILDTANIPLGSEKHTDWTQAGLHVGVQLALNAVTPERLEAVLDKVQRAHPGFRSG